MAADSPGDSQRAQTLRAAAADDALLEVGRKAVEDVLIEFRDNGISAFRNRYGFAAAHENVLNVVRIVFREPDDEKAADLIGLGNWTLEHEIAMGYDRPTDEAYEMRLVRALRPLAEQRRQAAARSLEDQ